MHPKFLGGIGRYSRQYSNPYVISISSYFIILTFLYTGCPKKCGVLVWNFNFKKNIAVKLLHLSSFENGFIQLSYGEQWRSQPDYLYIISPAMQISNYSHYSLLQKLIVFTVIEHEIFA